MGPRSGHRRQFSAAAALHGCSWYDNIPKLRRGSCGGLDLGCQQLKGLILNIHEIIMEHHFLVLVAGTGLIAMARMTLYIIQRQQLIVLAAIVKVYVLVLKVLRCNVLQRLSWLVVMVKVLGDRVRMLVVSHLHRYVNLDHLSSDSGRTK